ASRAIVDWAVDQTYYINFFLDDGKFLQTKLHSFLQLHVPKSDVLLYRAGGRRRLISEADVPMERAIKGFYDEPWSVHEPKQPHVPPPVDLGLYDPTSLGEINRQSFFLGSIPLDCPSLGRAARLRPAPIHIVRQNDIGQFPGLLAERFRRGGTPR